MMSNSGFFCLISCQGIFALCYLLEGLTSCSTSCTAHNFLEMPGQQGGYCSLLPPVARCFPDAQPGSLTSCHFTRLLFFFFRIRFPQIHRLCWIKLLRSLFLSVKHLQWDLVKRPGVAAQPSGWYFLRILFVASLGSLKRHFTPKVNP